MVATFSLVKIGVIKWRFEVFDLASIRLATFALLSSNWIFDWTQNKDGVGSQLSPHTWIELPSPTFQSKPSLIRSNQCMKILHIQKGLWLSLASNTLVAGQHFDFRICHVKESRNWMSLQICFARRALLKAFKSLNLKLLLDFVSPRSFHFLQWISNSLCMWPYQNLDIWKAIFL